MRNRLKWLGSLERHGTSQEMSPPDARHLSVMPVEGLIYNGNINQPPDPIRPRPAWSVHDRIGRLRIA
ncbi:hypothetical protein, partial [Sphingomonas sp.]|uniref:hypothetical protein n=1 Tax=Sphingomonas sp. TaxID=28214 RepID=UPI0028A2522C